MKPIFFVAASELQTRIGVTVLEAAMPGQLTAVDHDTVGVLRVLIDVPPGFALEQLSSTSRAVAARTLVLTGNESPIYADVLHGFGVAGITHFDDTPGSVEHAVRQALRGKQDRAYSVLSVSESRVMRHILRGLSSDDAASAYGASRKTTTAHVSTVLRKVGIPSRAALVARVLNGTA